MNNYFANNEDSSNQSPSQKKPPQRENQPESVKKISSHISIQLKTDNDESVFAQTPEKQQNMNPSQMVYHQADYEQYEQQVFLQHQEGNTPGQGFPSISKLSDAGAYHNAQQVSFANADDSPIQSEIDTVRSQNKVENQINPGIQRMIANNNNEYSQKSEMRSQDAANVVQGLIAQGEAQKQRQEQDQAHLMALFQQFNSQENNLNCSVKEENVAEDEIDFPDDPQVQLVNERFQARKQMPLSSNINNGSKMEKILEQRRLYHAENEFERQQLYLRDMQQEEVFNKVPHSNIQPPVVMADSEAHLKKLKEPLRSDEEDNGKIKPGDLLEGSSKQLVQLNKNQIEQIEQNQQNQLSHVQNELQQIKQKLNQKNENDHLNEFKENIQQQMKQIFSMVQVQNQQQPLSPQTQKMPERKKYSTNYKYKMRSVANKRIEDDPIIPQIDDLESAEHQMKKISAQQNQKRSYGNSIDKHQEIEDMSSIHPSMNQSNFQQMQDSFNKTYNNNYNNYSFKVQINSTDYESIQSQLHETRLMNSSLRANHTKLNREKIGLESKVEHQRKVLQQFQAEFKRQKQQDEETIHQLGQKLQSVMIKSQQRQQQVQSPGASSSHKSFRSDMQQFESLKIINREQSKTISDLKKLLNQTLNVKLKYEKIIQKMVSDEKLREFAIEKIKEVQSHMNESPLASQRSAQPKPPSSAPVSNDKPVDKVENLNKSLMVLMHSYNKDKSVIEEYQQQKELLESQRQKFQVMQQNKQQSNRSEKNH